MHPQAVIVVAEGVGQEWLGNTGAERDASDNVKLGDIGTSLRGQIEAYFKAERIQPVVSSNDSGTRSLAAHSF
jgi:6-phosphofructokinase 1